MPASPQKAPATSLASCPAQAHPQPRPSPTPGHRSPPVSLGSRVSRHVLPLGCFPTTLQEVRPPNKTGRLTSPVRATDTVGSHLTRASCPNHHVSSLGGGDRRTRTGGQAWPRRQRCTRVSARTLVRLHSFPTHRRAPDRLSLQGARWTVGRTGAAPPMGGSPPGKGVRQPAVRPRGSRGPSPKRPLRWEVAVTRLPPWNGKRDVCEAPTIVSETQACPLRNQTRKSGRKPLRVRFGHRRLVCRSSLEQMHEPARPTLTP